MAKIKAKVSVVKPAVAEETFDHYWVKEFRVQSNPNDKTRINATLVAVRDDVDGDGNPRKVMSGIRKQVNIPDLFARIKADPTGLLAQAFEALTKAIIAEDNELSE